MCFVLAHTRPHIREISRLSIILSDAWYVAQMCPENCLTGGGGAGGVWPILAMPAAFEP